MPITVTKPFFPPLEEYQALLAKIWENNWLTNQGPFAQELEARLKEVLSIDNIIFVNNGTIAIQIALKALNLSDEVITTPFSYVATTSSLVWEGFTPVMVDIDPETLNIDPSLIEAAITNRTTAILATHVFGNPCDVDAIEAIARKHNLKVIYDAAHAFGVKYKGRSLYSYGDASTASFHATKLFHTAEGGAIFFRNVADLQTASKMRNFGHTSPTTFDCVGINGKNSELHAAMGLVNLGYVPAIIAERKAISERYDAELSKEVTRPRLTVGCDVYNYAYYPILVRDEPTLENVIRTLESDDIIPRRYFYPSLNDLPYLNGDSADVPVAKDITKRILCLPLYPTLDADEQARVVKAVNRAVQP